MKSFIVRAAAKCNFCVTPAIDLLDFYSKKYEMSRFLMDF
jgi:hypothetical protein